MFFINWIRFLVWSANSLPSQGELRFSGQMQILIFRNNEKECFSLSMETTGNAFVFGAHRHISFIDKTRTHNQNVSEHITVLQLLGFYSSGEEVCA